MSIRHRNDMDRVLALLTEIRDLMKGEPESPDELTASLPSVHVKRISSDEGLASGNWRGHKWTVNVVRNSEHTADLRVWVGDSPSMTLEFDGVVRLRPDSSSIETEAQEIGAAILWSRLRAIAMATE